MTQGRMVSTNAVPEAQCSPDLLKKLDKEDPEKPEPVKLTIPQRQEVLLAALKKDGGLNCLEEWPPRKALALLLEFHHIFSLEPNEIGCTDATKHVIKLLKDKPFRRGFSILPFHWWMRCVNTSRRRWMAVPSDLPSHHGAMPWCC